MTFCRGSVDESANLLQKLLLKIIFQQVLLRTFRQSTFPPWAFSSLKNLFFENISTISKEFHLGELKASVDQVANLFAIQFFSVSVKPSKIYKYQLDPFFFFF